MPIKEMPEFIKSNKNVKNAIIYSFACCFCLLIQMLLMDKNVINIVFDILIPITAAICFACYAITMAMDRPIILICPPTVFFVSLLLNQLIAVEVGVKDTYPFITLIEMIPFLFFSFCVASCKYKKITIFVLKLFSSFLVLASLIITILAVFFRVIIYISRVHYMLNTFALIFSFFSVFFIYLTMIELVQIAGIKKKHRVKIKQF